MEIDIDNYRHAFNSFKKVLLERSDDYKGAISLFSSCYGIPVIVLYYYAEEILGKQDFIEEGKKSLTEFYDYSNIKGIKENK